MTKLGVFAVPRALVALGLQGRSQLLQILVGAILRYDEDEGETAQRRRNLEVLHDIERRLLEDVHVRRDRAARVNEYV